MKANSKDSLGDRMKIYENVSQNRLIRRTPVIIRIDGKAFHSFCKGFDKPFDQTMVNAMQSTLKCLCMSIQGCVFGYAQSDEISLLLKDWNTFETSAWFDNKVQKICSVSSSIATLAFNTNFRRLLEGPHGLKETAEEIEKKLGRSISGNRLELIDVYEKRIDKALFDSRCFNLSKEEVCNYFIWRQQDATRNSIQALAQTLFSHKELQGIGTRALQDKMFTEKDTNWNDLPTNLKRGTCCYYIQEENRWELDEEIPIFSQDRYYVEKWLESSVGDLQ